MNKDVGACLTAPGSRPSDQAPAGLAASRVDPSRKYGLGAFVTDQEYARFRHPTAHWWHIHPAKRPQATRAFGLILRRQYDSGATTAEIAQWWSKGVCVIRYALKLAGATLGQNRRSNPVRKLERNRDIVRLHDAGLTLREIGESFGISRERVRQVLGNMGVEPGSIGRASAERLFAELERRGFRVRRDSDGSPKGGDACGSVHDSAVAKPIAKGQSV